MFEQSAVSRAPTEDGGEQGTYEAGGEEGEEGQVELDEVVVGAGGLVVAVCCCGPITAHTQTHLKT